MSVKDIKASIECDGCGQIFKVDIDTADTGCVMDLVVEAIKDDFLLSSVQHDLHLCQDCTRIADRLGLEGDDEYQPTRDEILKAVGAIG